MDKMTLSRFTEITASKQPVPGGGGVSGLTGSLASALAEMVTNLTIGKKKYAEREEELIALRNKAEELRIRLLDSIDEDAEAFKPLAEAYGADKNSEGYAERLENCLRVAANSPYNILKMAAEVIELDERLAVIGSKLAVSDAATSVMLAHGALYGAYINILVNTRLMKDRTYAEKLDQEAEEILNKYSERALKCFEAVKERLTNG